MPGYIDADVALRQVFDTAPNTIDACRAISYSAVIVLDRRQWWFNQLAIAPWQEGRDVGDVIFDDASPSSIYQCQYPSRRDLTLFGCAYFAPPVDDPAHYPAASVCKTFCQGAYLIQLCMHTHKLVKCL